MAATETTRVAYYKGCLASLSAKELDTSTKALAPKLGCAFLDQRPRAAHFADVRDHRQHYLDVAVDGGPQQRPQLALEDVGPVEAHPDAAPAEERVVFLDREV